jgi:Ca2+-dependent lipid-binding protein
MQIGAAQISFINPPVLKLDFTGAANVADFSVIDDTVRKVILGIINSMFTLPNRFLLKLDANADYFKTYHYPLGMVRVTVEKAWGFGEEAKSSTRKLFNKLTRAAPDCYAKVDVGGEESWKTATKNNTNRPTWNETHDFVVSDFDQCIKVDVEDEDVNGDDEVGLAVTTVREILAARGSQELTLVHKGEETEGRVSISCQFFKYVADAGSLTASDHKGDGRLSGIATILVASAFGIKGQRKELKPSVVVTWGKTQRFQTAIKTDAPGTDISNPAFDQAFRLPITTDLVGSSPDKFRIALLDGEKEIGGVDIPFASVADAPDKILQQKFDVGNGATVRASIRLRGIVPGETPQVALPDRRK